MRNSLSTPATILAFVVATLYWFGRVEISTRNRFLGISDFLASSTVGHDDFVYSGFVFAVSFLSGFSILAWAIFNLLAGFTDTHKAQPEPGPLARLWKSYEWPHRMVLLVGLACFVLGTITGPRLALSLGALRDRAPFSISTAEATAYNRTLKLMLWLFTLNYIAAAVLAKESWRMLSSRQKAASAGVVGLFAFLYITTFASVTGFDAARVPKPEIDLSSAVEPMLQGSRAFLLGTMQDTYSLLVINNGAGSSESRTSRKLLLISHDQMPRLVIKGYENVY